MNKQIERKGLVKRLDFTVDQKSIGGYDADGWLEGYASTFGNVDNYGDRVMRGAFLKTIAERVSNGKVPLMIAHLAHGGGSKEVIGKITDAREDDKGLWIHAPFSTTATAQEVRQNIMGGFITGLSIGYEVISYSVSTEIFEGSERTIFNLEECRLVEITVTPFPVNEEAIIVRSKSKLTDDCMAGSTHHASEADFAEMQNDLHFNQSQLLKHMEEN